LSILFTKRSAVSIYWRNVYVIYNNRINVCVYIRILFRNLNVNKNVEYFLVTYRTRAPFADYLVHTSRYTVEANELMKWLLSLSFAQGGLFGRTALASGLCAAAQISAQRGADRRLMLVVSDQLPELHGCGCCERDDDAASHVARLRQFGVQLSCAAPRATVEFSSLFGAELDEPSEHVTRDPFRSEHPSHFVVLRELSVADAASKRTTTVPVWQGVIDARPLLRNVVPFEARAMAPTSHAASIGATVQAWPRLLSAARLANEPTPLPDLPGVLRLPLEAVSPAAEPVIAALSKAFAGRALLALRPDLFLAATGSGALMLLMPLSKSQQQATISIAVPSTSTVNR
jgi:hypothetical protein